MAIFILDEDISFPDPALANRDGLLAVGGDLSVERLLLAYSMGIFPWYDEETPILWWSPDPRMILLPENFKRSKSLRQTLNRSIYEIRYDTCFREVITFCSDIPRKDQPGTWITPEMITAYVDLHEAGYAHSVEAFRDGNLAGGLYGISLGKAFFGESMFFLERDASKVALSALVDRLYSQHYQFIDAQQKTEHLQRLGAQPIKRKDYLIMLKQALEHETNAGKW